jgi:hypothetical protein
MPDPVDELRNPRKAKDDFLKYLKDEIFTLNFYRAHMLYFIIVIAISSVIVYGEGVKNGPKEYRDSHLSYMDALFLTCSAMTTTGTLRTELSSGRTANKQRTELSGSGQFIWVPASGTVCVIDHWEHPVCFHGGGFDQTEHVPQAHVGSRKA